MIVSRSLLQGVSLRDSSFSAVHMWAQNRIAAGYGTVCSPLGLLPFPSALSSLQWAGHCWARLACQCGWKRALEGNASEMTGGIKATI